LAARNYVAADSEIDSDGGVISAFLFFLGVYREEATETCIEFVKFMRYEPYHSSTWSWGLGIEKEEENPR
jgi:hypothetical protein